jgi:hypothetical protein
MQIKKELSVKAKEAILGVAFREKLGYPINWENPKSFNEKINWLKLHYENPLLTVCADKYLVRNFIKERLSDGEKYLIPLLGVWDNVEQINWDELPQQFVLKTNWGTQQNIFVKDKLAFNIDVAKKKLIQWLEPQANHYSYSFEWAYKNIPPKIIAEKFIKPTSGHLLDYRFVCFNGELAFHIITDMGEGDINKVRESFYDKNWNPYRVLGTFKSFEECIAKPTNYDEMLHVAQTLSKEFPLVRVDFYEVDNRLYLGELTFYHSAGFTKFEPIEYDYLFGENLKLP